MVLENWYKIICLIKRFKPDARGCVFAPVNIPFGTMNHNLNTPVVIYNNCPCRGSASEVSMWQVNEPCSSRLRSLAEMAILATPAWHHCSLGGGRISGAAAHLTLTSLTPQGREAWGDSAGGCICLFQDRNRNWRNSQA